MNASGETADKHVTDTHMFERDPNVHILVLAHGVDVFPEGTFE